MIKQRQRADAQAAAAVRAAAAAAAAKTTAVGGEAGIVSPLNASMNTTVRMGHCSVRGKCDIDFPIVLLNVVCRSWSYYDRGTVG